MGWADPGPDWATKKKKAKKKEVAGPYRSQSSNPKIRSQATKSEHRKVRVKRKAAPEPTRQDVEEALGKGFKGKDGRFYRRSGSDYSRVLDALRDPNEKITGDSPGRQFVKDEAETALKAAKDSLKRAKSGEGHLKTPSSAQVTTALTAASLAAGGGAAGKAEKALAKAADVASDTSWAKTAAKKAASELKGAPKKKVARLKSAPERAARRIKETPQRVRTAPKRAKKAASTPEGRRAVAKGTGRKAAQHPFASVGGLGVVSNQSGADIPGLKQAGAFVEGHLQADPIESAKTTARAIPGIVTGPAAIVGAGATSALHGTTRPLEEEVSKQVKGLVDQGGKLLSGDPETVKKAVEDEVGYSFVAPAPALSRLAKTKAWKVPRSKFRTKVARKRGKTRAKRREEIRAYQEGKGPKPRKRVRHGVVDRQTGEEYVLRRTGKRINNRRARVSTANRVPYWKAKGERESGAASKEVVKEVRKSKLAHGEHNISDTLGTVAQYGISRDPTKAKRQLDEIEASIVSGKLDPDEISVNTINDLRNIQWLREHPEAFADKHFWKGVDAYKRQAKEIETSKRKTDLALGDVYGIARPEERLEAGVTVRGKKVRAPFYKQKETLERKRAELTELRTDAKRYREAMAKASPEERQKYSHLADQMAAKASVLKRELRDARLGYKQAQKDYGSAVAATRQEKGFEPPAYVKDTRPGGEVGVSAAYGARSAQSQRMADVAQTYRGQVFNRRFEDVVNESIAGPRMKQAMHDATSEWADQWKTEVDGGFYVTSDQIQRAVNRGELDPSQFEAFDAQHFKQAILDPNKTIDKAGEEVSSSLSSLKGEVLGRANEPGKKYLVVPKEAAREFVHQFEPPKGGLKVVGDANRLFTRVILGYSPAWALAQVVAEGIPAAVSIGVNPLRWARVAEYLARENKRLTRKDKSAIDAMAGESPGVTPHPMTSFKPDTNKLASRFFRLSNRNPLGRALLSTATGSALGVFDRWKGGKYRKAVAAAKADREMNNFVTSLSGLMRGQRSVVEAIKGKSLDAQMEYLAKHPAQMAKLEGYLNNVMGNWRALTRHEAKFAPFIAFYPFVRYSLRWTFWSFPKEHPIKAQILYFLSQQNAEELEKIIGGPPANPVDYTFPVYTNSQGTDSVMPGGQRFAPGMNALTTAIGKGRIENLATALNPPIGMALTAVTGIDPFTGEKVANTPAEHGLLALNQLLSIGAPLRATLPDPLGGKSVRDTVLEAVGKEPPSDVSKAFKGMDPNREARSFINPLAPQSPERYRDSVKLSNALDESGGEPRLGEDLLTQAVLAARRGDRRLVKQLIAKRRSSEKASDEITRLIREYVAEPQKLAEFTKADWKVVNEITGEMVIPVPTAAEKRKEEEKENPFGLPSTDASDLRKEFGLPSTSTADLRKQFGIE